MSDPVPLAGSARRPAHGLPPHRRLGVLNAGISGNRLLLPGNPPVFGPSALDRSATTGRS